MQNIFMLLLLALHSCCCSTEARGLRKKPKVYNALITTDENLTSSRAYPVIQPTLHESGYAHAPFGPYNPYTVYTPPVVRFGQPIVPGLETNERLPYPLPAHQFPPQFSAYPQNSAEAAQTPTAPAERVPDESDGPPPVAMEPMEIPTAPSAPDSNAPKETPKEQLPIPLNEYGLPPVLIPLSSSHQQQQQYTPQAQQSPINLPPYAFNQYPPLLFNQLSREREHFLPHYDYYPNHAYAVAGTGERAPAVNSETGVPNNEQSSIQQNEAAYPKVPETTAVSPTQRRPDQLPSLVAEAAPPSFEDIKNGASNKNVNVPDVPPPPIPSGPKRPRPAESA